MSTAGKVLAGCVTVFLLVWLVLISAVDQLNRNWGEELKKHKDAYVKTKEDLRTERAKLEAHKSTVIGEQVAGEKRLMVLRRELSRVQAELTVNLEALTRDKLQLQSVTAAQANAETEKKQREQEKTDTEKQLADTREAVQQLKAKNEELLAELTKLRETFVQTLQENKQMLHKLDSASARRSGVRPAVLGR